MPSIFSQEARAQVPPFHACDRRTQQSGSRNTSWAYRQTIPPNHGGISRRHGVSSSRQEKGSRRQLLKEDHTGKTGAGETLSAGSDLTKKQVGQVLDILGAVIGKQLGKKGSGIFILPGLLKIARVSKPARKAGKKPNPFKPGEMMVVKARAAHNIVKVRPLKRLKDMV